MKTTSSRAYDDGLADDLALAFAPIHKRALGLAAGIVIGLAVFLVTAVGILRQDAPQILYVFRFFLPGHEISWAGAVKGGLGAGFASFVGAWFLAFCRNFVLAASVWVARTRAELAQTRDFLDHI